MLSPRSLLAVAAGAVLFSIPAFAWDQIPELERIVPVPADQQVPIIDFFRKDLFSYPQINRAGTRLAAVVANTLNARDLVLVDLENNSMDRISGDVTEDVYNFRWLTDDRVLFTIAGRAFGSEFRVVQVNHPNGSYPVIRFGYIGLVGIPEQDRLHPLLWVAGDPFGGDDIGVIQINAMERLADGNQRGNTFYGSSTRDDPSMMKIYNSYPRLPGVAVEYFSDKDGALAFGVTIKAGYATLYRLDGDHWDKCPVDLDHTKVLGAGDVPGELIVAGPERTDGQPSPVRRMDAATGQPGEVLFQDRRYDCEDAWMDRSQTTLKVIGVHFQRRTAGAIWFDPVHQSLQTAFSAYFPGKVVEIVSKDDAEKKFILKVSSDVDPGSYWLVDLDKHSKGLLKNIAPWIDPARMRPRKAIAYLSRDGIPLEAYLTLPAGASKAHPAPLVVYPHGGPWSRDTGGFDAIAEYLASRGYAVLQPNYRGSTDYNWRFPYEDRFDFVKMRNDVTDGTKALIRSGIVDKNRIAIMGGSFGAYLSLCGAAFEPDMYRCAVSLAGVFDWEQVMDEAHQESYLDNPEFEYLIRHLGDPKTNAAKFDATSPLRHADQIKIPIFIFHGWDDRTASIAESKALISALESHHVPYEKHFLEQEGHGLFKIQDRIDIFTDIEAFLAKNMGGAPTAQDAAPSPVAAAH